MWKGFPDTTMRNSRRHPDDAHTPNGTGGFTSKLMDIPAATLFFVPIPSLTYKTRSWKVAALKQSQLVTDRQAGLLARATFASRATGRGKVPASPDGKDGRLGLRFVVSNNHPIMDKREFISHEA